MEITNREIDAILFDFHGVLMFCKEEYQAPEIVENIDAIISGVTDDKKFKAEAMAKFQLSEQEFGHVLEQIIDRYEPFEALWALLPQLRRFYKLAIINNGTTLTLNGFKANVPIDSRFDLLVSSAIEGVRKPDAKIFLCTASRLEVSPERCLFMDDLFENTEGARKVGMKTIWWKDKASGFNEFIAFLKKRD